MTPAEVVRRAFAAWAIAVLVPIIRAIGVLDDLSRRGEDE